VGHSLVVADVLTSAIWTCRPAPQEEGPLPLPLTSPKLLTVLEAEGGQDGEPSLTGSRDASDVSGVFDGVEQALAWARQLTLEELRIELDFLGEPVGGQWGTSAAGTSGAGLT
jgi:hypothetical protein